MEVVLFTRTNLSTKLERGLFQAREFIALQSNLSEAVMTVVTPKFGMGASVLRLEDQTFITGKGRYTDDIAPAGVLHGYVLRSPVAKAQFRIGSVRGRQGRARRPSGADRRGSWRISATCDPASCRASRTGPGRRRATSRSSAAIRCNYVGDAVAFVVADSRALAQDAAELIEIDYDAETPRRRPRRRSTLIRRWSGRNSARNRAFTYQLGDRAKTEAAFAKAAQVTRIEFSNNRLVCNYMEAALGDRRVEAGRGPLRADHRLAGRAFGADDPRRQVFKIEQTKLRVITPDVGGGFGPKTLRLPRVSRWSWRRRSALAGRSNGRATAPSIS